MIDTIRSVEKYYLYSSEIQQIGVTTELRVYLILPEA